MTTDAPYCVLCEIPIAAGEFWEYEKGATPISTPENEKRRVHSACVAALQRRSCTGYRVAAGAVSLLRNPRSWN